MNQKDFRALEIVHIYKLKAYAKLWECVYNDSYDHSRIILKQLKADALVIQDIERQLAEAALGVTLEEANRDFPF